MAKPKPTCTFTKEKGFKDIYKTSCNNYYSGDVPLVCPYCEGDTVFNVGDMFNLVQPPEHINCRSTVRNLGAVLAASELSRLTAKYGSEEDTKRKRYGLSGQSIIHESVWDDGQELAKLELK